MLGIYQGNRYGMENMNRYNQPGMGVYNNFQPGFAFSPE